MLVFFFLPVFAFCQGDSLNRRQPDIIRFVDAVAFTALSPARWSGKDFLMLGGVTAGTAALMLIDEPVRRFWQKQDSEFLDVVERVGYHYGKPYSAVVFTTGFYVTGLLLKNEWLKETGLLLGTVLLTSGFTQTLLKDALGRARPATELGNFVFRPFRHSPAYHSFPSGHQAVAFTISFVIAKRSRSLPVQLACYTLAASTAVSRMYSDSHWVSDMAFGGVLAWFCADTAILRLQTNRFKKKLPGKRITWRAYPYPGGLCLRAVL